MQDGQGRHAGLPLRVEAAGAAAVEVLEQARAGSVIGMTSRGVFLELRADTQTPDQASPLFSSLPAWVIFLSAERFYGPLTLNLEAGAGKSLKVEHMAQVRILEGEIFFPASGLTVATRAAHPWKAPAPGATALNIDLRRRQVRDLLLQARPAAPDMRLVNLLALALDETISIDRENQPEQALFKGLQAAARQGEAQALLQALSSFLGRGAGLTPSGDDLVCGFLLALNRWQGLFAPGLAPALNDAIVERTAAATSRLSASLIACACLGQADERLVLALDGLVTGRPEAQTCIASLASYGRSSGFDALLGMAAALQCSGEFSQPDYTDPLIP